MHKRIISLVLLLALTAAACGSGSSADALATLNDAGDSNTGVASLDGSTGTGTADEPVADMDAEEAMLAFAACLREEGLEVSDPEMGEDGEIRLGRIVRPSDESTFDREEMRTAMEACSEYRELIATQFRDIDSTEREDQIFAYAECMRDNGYEMADPDFSSEPGEGEGQGQGGGPFGDLDRDDPDFQAAQEVCQDLFVGGLGGGPGGGGRRG